MHSFFSRCAHPGSLDTGQFGDNVPWPLDALARRIQETILALALCTSVVNYTIVVYWLKGL